MKFAIKFRPELEEDALNAYYWYEEKAAGLGEDFIRIFYASITEIQRNPFSHKKIHKISEENCYAAFLIPSII